MPANATDAIELLGGLIAFTEHGAEKFLSAVEHGNVAELYKDAETAGKDVLDVLDGQAPAATPTEAPAGPTSEQLAQLLSQNQQILNALAAQQHTQVTVAPEEPASEVKS